MVKFSLLALAGALATASAAAPVAKKTLKLGNPKLRRGDARTEALLRKARPYHAAAKNAAPARRLEGEDGDGEFEMDGTYNLKFSKCVDVKVSNEDLFDENVVAYAKEGQVMAVQSYVLFHVCNYDDCFYDGTADLYMVDLPTYLATISQYHANKRNDYCESCNEFEDYCNPEEEEAEDEEGEENEEDEEEDREEDEEEDERDEEEDEEEEDDRDEEEEDEKDEEEDDKDEEEEDNKDEEEGEEDDKEDRKLKKANRKLSRAAITRKLANKEYIDCDQCQYYNCFVDQEDLDDGAVNQDEVDEQISEWIGELAECKETGAQWGNLDLYVGAMCSSYGDGVELAVFVNEDCTLYTNQKAFNDVYNPYNDNEDGINMVTYAENYIKNAFYEVTSCLQPEYADPDEEEDENNEEEEEEEMYEVNEYCQQIMEGGAVNYNNCAYENDGENENNAEENDDATNWYMYDMQEAEDIEEVCYTMNQMDGEFTNYYDEELSGTWYQRGRSGTIINGEEPSTMTLTPGLIAAIVGVCLVVVAGACFLCFKPKKKESNEAVYQGGTML